jgi:hypothetical protein
MEGEFQSGGESSLFMIFSQVFNRMFSYIPMLMPINIVVNIHKQNKMAPHKPNTSIQHMREGSWVGNNEQSDMFCQTKTKYPCEVVQVYDLPQNLPTNSL